MEKTPALQSQNRGFFYDSFGVVSVSLGSGGA